ncbi:unnamed protein product [Musa hybrid cultivar]
MFTCSVRTFLEKYVRRYREVAPELMDVYNVITHQKEQSEELGTGILPCDHEDKLHRRHDCTWGIWQGRKIIRVNNRLIARGSLLSLTLWILDVSYTCKSIVPRNFGRC